MQFRDLNHLFFNARILLIDELQQNEQESIRLFAQTGQINIGMWNGRPFLTENDYNTWKEDMNRLFQEFGHIFNNY